MTGSWRGGALCALCVVLLLAAPAAFGQKAAPAPAPAPASTPAKTGEKELADKSASPRMKNDPQAVELLQRIEQKYGAIKTFSGAFRQVRKDPAFDEKIESQGRFHIMKPSNFRAEYYSPNESVNLISGQYSYRYVKQLKQVERYKFKGEDNVRDLNYMLLGFGVKTDDLLRVYYAQWLGESMGKGYQAVKLVPRDRQDANFKHLSIVITADDQLLPAQFSLEQLDGALVTANLDLKSLEIGGSIDEKLFRPDFPRDAQVVDIE
ncbi:MAG: outer membrane lipoprotein carrier protein LolA [bacterium]|nr:outer membrane lipoprotein carrier protein LolA [Candidatus Sumerlaeota bacterium]